MTRRWRRTPGVLWRLGSDRVLLRRVGERHEESIVDVVGPAAAVWVALDTPATTDEVTERLGDADVVHIDAEAVAEGVRLLSQSQLIEEHHL